MGPTSPTKLNSKNYGKLTKGVDNGPVQLRGLTNILSQQRPVNNPGFSGKGARPLGQGGRNAPQGLAALRKLIPATYAQAPHGSFSSTSPLLGRITDSLPRHNGNHTYSRLLGMAKQKAEARS